MRLLVVPAWLPWMLRTDEYELHHVARLFGAVREAGVNHVEMEQEEGAGLDVVQHHAVRRYRMGVEVAAGLYPSRPHLHRRVVWKVEADQIAWQVVAGARERALRVLMPAGAGPRTLAHGRRVDFRRQRLGAIFHRRAVVNGAMRMQVVARAGDGGQCAMHHRAVQHVVHLRHACEDVVAVPGLALHGEAQQRVDLLVGVGRHVRRQAQEAVGDELAHLIVVEQFGWRHGEYLSACSNGRSTAASASALVSA